MMHGIPRVTIAKKKIRIGQAPDRQEVAVTLVIAILPQDLAAVMGNP